MSAEAVVAAHARNPGRTLGTGLMVGALGVVFGDIGTSPIYTLQTVFNPDDPHPVPMSIDNLYGVVSLVFWSVMIIVTVTYVMLVMQADNDGEGGVMALITLVRRIGGRSDARTIAVLSALGILGAALFFGDSMITPAISVLSAVEGLKVVDPQLGEWVVPITAVIILGLFAVQRHGYRSGRPVLRPGDDLWFVVDRRLRRSRHHRPPADPASALADGMHWNSWPVISTSRSSPWPRSFCRSPAPKRSTPTWGISAGGRSRWRGWHWCCPAWC